MKKILSLIAVVAASCLTVSAQQSVRAYQYEQAVLASNLVLVSTQSTNFSQTAGNQQIFQLHGSTIGPQILTTWQLAYLCGSAGTIVVTVIPGQNFPNFSCLVGGTNSVPGAINTNAAVSQGYLWASNNPITITIDVPTATTPSLYVTNIPISVPTNCQALLFSSATNSSTSTNQLSGVVGAWH